MVTAKDFVKRLINDNLSAKLVGDDFKLENITIDSRKLEQGQIFWALNENAEKYIPEALVKGAIAIIAKNEIHNLAIPQIIVNNPSEALLTLAKQKRNLSSARFIGITGSNGKSSTKEILRYLLSKIGRVHANFANQNNELGVPLTLANIKGDEDFVVVEMGARNQGDIAYLCDFVKPEIALITNTSPAHMETFGEFINLIKTKGEIYEAAEKIVLSLDNPPEALQYYQNNFAEKITTTFALNSGDFFATNITENGSKFFIPAINCEINWQLLGEHNIRNALAALAVLSALKVNLKIIQSLNDFVMPLTGRSRLIKYKNHIVIDDTYNANPASFKAALMVLAGRNEKNKIVYAGKMAELGNHHSAHLEITELAQQLSLKIIAVNCEDYGVTNLSKEKAKAQLLQDLDSELSTAILVKGSRSSALEEIFPEDLLCYMR